MVEGCQCWLGYWGWFVGDQRESCIVAGDMVLALDIVAIDGAFADEKIPLSLPWR